MKRVLVAVISCQDFPYGEMIGTSLRTWDSVEVEGVETIFYCGNPQKGNTDKIVYFNIPESLFAMGHKDLAFFDWAIQHKQFDYIARVNASCFVDKKELIKYCQTLPDKEVFEGLEVVTTDGTPNWIWGGGMFLISRDVIELILKNKSQWNHQQMEDMAMSLLVGRLGILFRAGRACSIDNMASGSHSCMVYGHGLGFRFSTWSEFKKPEGQYFYRVKQDNNRHLENDIMEQLKRICYDTEG